MNGIISTNNLITYSRDVEASGSVTSIRGADMNILPKKCSKCGQWKSRGEFYKHNNNKDRLFPWCKACERIRDQQWRKENPQKVRDIANRRYARNPEKLKARVRDYYHENRDIVSDRVKAWKKANPAKVNAINGNRRARKKEVGGTFTAQEWKSLKEFYNFTCLCCGRCEPEIKLTPDHVIPLADVENSSNTIDNIQPLCYSCNSSKQAKHIDYR